jgi:hypothetical protein
LYELARGLDFSRLYLALDAMALLAASTGQLAIAARIARAAETSHASHGQLCRRPAAARLRAAVRQNLESALGPGWQPPEGAASRPMPETEACELALGLRA